jgi:hypothetical protein
MAGTFNVEEECGLSLSNEKWQFDCLIETIRVRKWLNRNIVES